MAEIGSAKGKLNFVWSLHSPNFPLAPFPFEFLKEFYGSKLNLNEAYRKLVVKPKLGHYVGRFSL